MAAEDSICEVCKQKKTIAGVASSTLGPVSLAFCIDCLQNHAEPKSLIEFVIEEDNWRIHLDGFFDVVHFYEDGKYKPASELKRSLSHVKHKPSK